MMLYLAAILIFILIWILSSLILFSVFYKERAIDKLKYYDNDYIDKPKLEKHNMQNTQKSAVRNSLLQLFLYLGKGLNLNKKHYRKVELDLIRADIPITVEQLLIIKIFSSVIAGFLILALSKDYIITFIVFILIWNSPAIIISRKKKERIRLFDSQLGDGITIISNALKAGHSFLHAIAIVIEETKDPFSKEFKKVLKEMSLGIPEEDAFKNLTERMESEDLKLMVNAILIQKDIGGNLSEILDNISTTIMERQSIKNELKTLTAQGKLSGVIVSLLPLFLAFFIYIMNREYILMLFNNTVGLLMISISLINQVFGILLIRKIVNIDF